LPIGEDGAVDAFEGSIDDRLSDVIEDIFLLCLRSEYMIKAESQFLFPVSFLLFDGDINVRSVDDERRGLLSVLVGSDSDKNPNFIFLLDLHHYYYTSLNYKVNSTRSFIYFSTYKCLQSL
jgi:hypothetical protein